MYSHLKLIRPLNCIMSGTAVLAVAIILRGIYFYQSWIFIVLGFLITFFITAGGNVLNDYFDIEIDKINHPDRPLVSGKVSLSSARYLVIIFFIISLILAWSINYYILVIVIIAILLLIGYEASLKNRGFVGNIVISSLVMTLFLFGGMLFDRIMLILFFALMAFFATLGREIIKDVEDMQGDVTRKTLPKQMGIKNASVAAAGMFVISVAISPLPYAIGMFNEWYLYAVLIADLVFIYSTVIQFKDPEKGKRFSKYAMILGLFSYVLGGIV